MTWRREPAVRRALATGELLTVADVDPTDAGERSALEEMLAGFTAGHHRQRFLSSSRTAAHAYLEGLPDRHRTLVALTGRLGSRVVGVASAHPTGPGRAEVALAVGEGEHGTGVGTLLLEEVVRRCRLVGVLHLEATVLPGNTEIQAVLRDLGCVVHQHVDPVEVEVDLDLTDAEPLSSATRRRRRRATTQVLRRATAPSHLLVVGPGSARSVPGPGDAGVLVIVTSASVAALRRLERLHLGDDVVGVALVRDPPDTRGEALLGEALRETTCPLWRAGESAWALRLLQTARARLTRPGSDRSHRHEPQEPGDPREPADPLAPLEPDAVRTCLVTARGGGYGDPLNRLRDWPWEETVVADVSPPELQAEDGACFAASVGCTVTLVDRAALGLAPRPPAWALATTDEAHLVAVLDLLSHGSPTASTVVIGAQPWAGRLADRLWHRWNLRPAHLTDATQGRVRLLVPRVDMGPGVLLVPEGSDQPTAPGWAGVLAAVSEDPWVDLVVVSTVDAASVPPLVDAGCSAGRGPTGQDLPGPPTAPVVVVTPASGAHP